MKQSLQQLTGPLSCPKSLQLSPTKAASRVTTLLPVLAMKGVRLTISLMEGKRNISIQSICFSLLRSLGRDVEVAVFAVNPAN